jgi:hypothetical protein
VLRCDEKNIKEHYVFNVCGVVITTNHKTHAIRSGRRAGLGDATGNATGGFGWKKYQRNQASPTGFEPVHRP